MSQRFLIKLWLMLIRILKSMKSKIEEILKKFDKKDLFGIDTYNIIHSINKQMLDVRKDYKRRCCVSEKALYQIDFNS